MPMKFGHPRCVLSVYKRDHWRRCLRVAQRFEDSKAVDTGTNVNNRDINIVQSKAEDVEYLSSAASRYNTASRFPRGFPVCFHHGVLAFLQNFWPQLHVTGLKPTARKSRPPQPGDDCRATAHDVPE